MLFLRRKTDLIFVFCDNTESFLSPWRHRKGRTDAYISIRHRRALPAHYSPDLAALGTGVEVVTGTLVGDSLYLALNTDLHTHDE